MPIVNLKINDILYQVACGEGEESHLQNLAMKLEEKLQKMAKRNKANDNKILLLTALMLEDEVGELKQKLTNKYDAPTKDVQEQCDNAIINTMDTITNYVENLAKKLEKM